MLVDLGLWRPYRDSFMQLEHLDFLSPLGRQHRLTLAWPDTPAPADGWPLLCVLDLPQFEAVLATCEKQAPQACAVLGIGYGGEVWRDQDFTPALNGEAGHAPDFLAMMQDVFLPWAYAQAPLNAQRRLLCGHSLGGLFALQLLYQQPELFDALVVSSPSVWWGEGYLARLLAQPLPKAAMTMPVQFSVGEFEQSLGPAEEAMPEDKRELRRLRLQERRMVDGTRELAQALAQQQGGEPRFRIVPGCNHSQSGLAALPQGCLEWLAE